MIVVRADLIPAFGKPHYAVLPEQLPFVPGDGFFAAPVIFEPLRDRLANRLAQRGIADDAHEVVERRPIFRPQRRGVVPPPLPAIAQRQQRDRNAQGRQLKLLEIVMIAMAGRMRAQPRLLNGQPHRQRRIPGLGGSRGIAEPLLQRRLQLPALLRRQALGVPVLRRGGLLEQALLPFRRKRGHGLDGALHIPRRPPRVRAGGADGWRAGRTPGRQLRQQALPGSSGSGRRGGARPRRGGSGGGSGRRRSRHGMGAAEGGDGTRVGMVRSRKCAASVPASFRQAAAPCPNSSPALRNRLQSHLACHREM